jgi:hypothetical protein
MRIRDPGWRQFGSGIRKVGSGIRDKHPGSATLSFLFFASVVMLEKGSIEEEIFHCFL